MVYWLSCVQPGSVLWSPSLKVIEVALNNILHKIGKLPGHSHTAIVHSVSHVEIVSNLFYKRFCSLLSRATASPSALVYKLCVL